MRSPSGLFFVAVLLAVSIAVQHPASSRGDDVCLDCSARDAADWVLASLFASDGRRLASAVHLEKGVRFSPSAFVNVAEHLVVSRSGAETFWAEDRIYRWGYAEGTGEPIDLTPTAYTDRFITHMPFRSATAVIIDNERQRGTTGDNSGEVYEGATRVDFLVDPGSETSGNAQDWAVLRLVFEPVGSCWQLIGIISDRWSP